MFYPILKNNFSFAASRTIHQQTVMCSDSLIYKVTKLVYKVDVLYLSPLRGKPTTCIGENIDADQLRGNREADQRLYFRYTDSTIPLLLKSEIIALFCAYTARFV